MRTSSRACFAVNSTLQLEQGIDMQPAEIMEAELSRGQHRQNGDVWLDFVSKSADNITWCIEQGVMYSGKVDDYRVGLFPTFHWFKDGKAAVGYVEPMKARLEELSVQLHLKTAVNGLVMKNGRVIGAYADGGEGVVRYSAKRWCSQPAASAQRGDRRRAGLEHRWHAHRGLAERCRRRLSHSHGQRRMQLHGRFGSVHPVRYRGFSSHRLPRCG